MKLKIKELRSEFQITQKELADKIGNTQRNVCNWENGKSEPDYDSLVKVADLFGVTLDELFGREQPSLETRGPAETDRLILRSIRMLNDEQKDTLLEFLQTINS